MTAEGFALYNLTGRSGFQQSVRNSKRDVQFGTAGGSARIFIVLDLNSAFGRLLFVFFGKSEHRPADDI